MRPDRRAKRLPRFACAEFFARAVHAAAQALSNVRMYYLLPILRIAMDGDTRNISPSFACET